MGSSVRRTRHPSGSLQSAQVGQVNNTQVVHVRFRRTWQDVPAAGQIAHQRAQVGQVDDTVMFTLPVTPEQHEAHTPIFFFMNSLALSIAFFKLSSPAAEFVEVRTLANAVKIVSVSFAGSVYPLAPS